MPNSKLITVLNPLGTPPKIERVPMAPRLDTLDGKNIVIVDVNFPMTEQFYDAAINLLKEKYPKVNWVVKSKTGSFFNKQPEFWKEIKEEADGAVVGPGHMDTLGPAVVGWCVKLEKMGVPAVPLICAITPEMEKKVAFENGMEHMRLTFIPYEVVGTSEERCRQILEGDDPITGIPVLDEINDCLTRQPTEVESKTGIIDRTIPRLMPQDTEENLNRSFINNGWTDYLPIVLPTEQRVAEMLKGTSRKANERVGKMFPSTPHEAWEYTVEQVAVNAVMAGAKPDHFPVILAIAASGETSLWSSVTSQNRMVVINGPIRNEINMNSGIGAMSPFNEANAVIGRAWTLISKNLGGGAGKAGITYLGALGNSFNYNNICIPENEEGLPEGWTPLHIQKGFRSNESTASIFSGFGIIHGGSLPDKPHSQVIKNLFNGMKTYAMVSFYRGEVMGMRGVLLITPQGAEFLKEEGFQSKETYHDWLAENLNDPGIPKDKQLASNIDIIVVGGCIYAYAPGNMHYVRTVSIDEWR